jgi:hypothetical protein
MVRAYENFLTDLPVSPRSIGAAMMIGGILALLITLMIRGVAAPAGGPARNRGPVVPVAAWIGMIVAALFGALLAFISVLHLIAEFNANTLRPKSMMGGVVTVGCGVASIWAIVSTAFELVLTRSERDHVQD